MRVTLKAALAAIGFFFVMMSAAFSVDRMGKSLVYYLSPERALASESNPPAYDDLPLPKEVSLCGEPIPLENPLVWERLDREFNIGVWDRAQVFMWLKRAGRYFPYIEKELEAAGMPADLKYLPVAESSLLTHVRSYEGAIGTWQFMAHTARRSGLRKDQAVDERLSFEHSTQAALLYLRQLKERFGTWTLALSAYNCGEARLAREIKEQKVQDYYRLNLPLETERFVFRIAAIKIIMENSERYGFEVAPDRIYQPVKCDTEPVDIPIPIHITDLAQALGTDFKILKELNPQILGYYLPQGEYKIKVPAGKGAELADALKALTANASRSQKKVSDRYYVVQSGDTLSHIAKRTGVSMDMLKQLNSIRDARIRVGQKLWLGP